MRAAERARVGLIDPPEFRRLLFDTPIAFQRVIRAFRPVMERLGAAEQQREKLAALGPHVGRAGARAQQPGRGGQAHRRRAGRRARRARRRDARVRRVGRRARRGRGVPRSSRPRRSRARRTAVAARRARRPPTPRTRSASGWRRTTSPDAWQLAEPLAVRRARRRLARGGGRPGRHGAADRGALDRHDAHRPLAERRPARLDRSACRSSCRRSRPTRTWTRRRCRRSTCTRGSTRRSRSSTTSSSTRGSRSSATTPPTCRGCACTAPSSTRSGRTCSTTRSTRSARPGRSGSPPRRGTTSGVEVRISDDGPGIPGRAAAPRVRAVLHHQGGRLGHRPGARHDAPDRARAPRRRPAPGLAAGPDDVHRAPAARARARASAATEASAATARS